MCRISSNTRSISFNNVSNRKTDPTQTRLKSTKKVRFAENKIAFTSSIDQISEQEMKNIWYNEEDYRKFRIDSHIISSSVRSKIKYLDKSLLKGYLAAEKGNMESSVKSLLKWTESLDPSVTCRGIEDMCNNELSQKTYRDQRRVIKMVLVSQHKNVDEKCTNSEILREISEKESRTSRILASAIAIVDSIQNNGITQPKSISFAKRLSNVIRSKKSIIPI